jgi:hypothetical protein
MRFLASSMQGPNWNGKCFGKRGLAGVPAADLLVLIAGLSRSIDAIKESRGIFQRMNNDALHCIAADRVFDARRPSPLRK